MGQQKPVSFQQMTRDEAKQAGHATFNNCNHYVADMSHLESRTEDYMNTISIKLPNGNSITLSVMQLSKGQTCIDTQFHGDNIKQHRLLAMGEGKDVNVYNKSIYALIADANEVK